MGAFVSRQNARVEEVDNNSNNAYKYPPKSGMLEIYKFIRIYDLFLLLLAIKIFCLKIQ
jgi:hypothetical protein